MRFVLTVYSSQRGPSGPKFLVSGGYFVRKRLQYRITKKKCISVYNHIYTYCLDSCKTRRAVEIFKASNFEVSFTYI